MFAPASQSILSVIFLFVVFAVATPAPWGGTPTSTVTVTATPTPTSAGNCNTGDLQCCNQVESANSSGGSLLLGLLGIVVSPLDALIGVSCSPITVIGLAQGGCSASPVCCQNNNVGGLISIGCVPIIL